jgi:hypothetical protein
MFSLDPRYFPTSTLSILPVESLLRHGVLPLGLKANRILNLGFLEPESKPDVLAIQALLPAENFQRFKIEVEPMLSIFEQCYGLSRNTILEMSASQVHHLIYVKLKEDLEGNEVP